MVETIDDLRRSAARLLSATILALLLAAAISGAEAADQNADRLAIADMAYCYAYAVDTLGNNPPTQGTVDTALAEATEMFKGCLTDDAKLLLFLDGPKGKATPMGAGGPAEFAKAVRNYFTAYGYVATQHVVGNIRVTFVTPDRAKVDSYIPALHWLADGRVLLVPVRYEDEAVRVGDRWKVATRNVLALRFWVTDGYAPNPVDPTMARPK
jgi:hypothetical protein